MAAQPSSLAAPTHRQRAVSLEQDKPLLALPASTRAPPPGPALRKAPRRGLGKWPTFREAEIRRLLAVPWCRVGTTPTVPTGQAPVTHPLALHPAVRRITGATTASRTETSATIRLCRSPEFLPSSRKHCCAVRSRPLSPNGAMAAAFFAGASKLKSAVELNDRSFFLHPADWRLARA